MLFTTLGAGGSKALAFAKSCTYDYQVETEKIQDKDAKQGGREERIGSAISISSENNVQANMADYLKLVEIAQKGTEIDYFFGVVDNPDKDGRNASEWTGSTTGLKGKAIITNISLTAPAESIATFSLKLNGTSEPSIVPTPSVGG